MVTTPAEQEAERRYLSGLLPPSLSDHMRRKDRAEAFVEGWNECESRYRELLEAAREWVAAKREYAGSMTPENRVSLLTADARLLAAAAALEEADEDAG